MLVKYLKKSAFLLPLLMTSTITHAQIPCPSLDTLHQYATSIEVGQIDLDGTYSAYSLPIIDTEKGSFWMLFVNYMNAKSDEEAINIAQTSVKNATIQSNGYPYKMVLMNSDTYICGYGENIFLFGGKNQENISIPVSVKKMRPLFTHIKK